MKSKKIQTTPDPTTKVGRYYMARKAGATKKTAKAVAGYSPNTLPATIENTEAYKSISYKDALLNQITLQEIAEITKRNIIQDKDLGASNTAIKNAMEYIEPEKTTQEPDKVIIVFKENAQPIQADILDIDNNSVLLKDNETQENAQNTPIQT